MEEIAPAETAGASSEVPYYGEIFVDIKIMYLAHFSAYKTEEKRFRKFLPNTFLLQLVDFYANLRSVSGVSQRHLSSY